MIERKFRVLHFFCGMGGKGLGAKEAAAAFGEHTATFETIGGIDFDAKACLDFEMLVGAPTLCIDVHLLEPEQLRAFAGDQAPDAIMMSPPCKGFSGLLSAKRAKEEKYQRMNTLMLRALLLCMSTWPTMPPLIFVENVPRIESRGKVMLRQCEALGEAHGYAMKTGTHDCGELGNLAQHRRRWFAVWRHREQVPQLLYEPPKFPVRACGEVLSPLPMPGDVETAGPMHSVPRLSWRNWLRLALIPAGGDWRDLPGTLVDGEKRRPWDEAAGTVAGESLPNNGKFSVADPRFSDGKKKNWQQVAGVTAWTSSSPTVTSGAKIHAGAFQVADPRIELPAPRYRVMTLAEALALDLNPDRPPPFIPVIIAADGTWHRPLTTLELAVLQSFPWLFNGKPLVLAGTSHTRWREAIGNAVPPKAGKAVAAQLLRTLLLSSLGVFTLSSNEVWVAPIGALVA